MEEKNEQQVMRTVSDEELQQVSVVSILWATMSARSTGHRSRAFLSRNVVGTPARSDVLRAPNTFNGKAEGGWDPQSSPLSNPLATPRRHSHPRRCRWR